MGEVNLGVTSRCQEVFEKFRGDVSKHLSVRRVRFEKPIISIINHDMEFKMTSVEVVSLVVSLVSLAGGFGYAGIQIGKWIGERK